MRVPNMLVARRWRRGKRCSTWKVWIFKGGENSEAADSSVVDLAEAFEKVQLLETSIERVKTSLWLLRT